MSVWDLLTWAAILVLGPGAILVFVAFLRDLISWGAPGAPQAPQRSGRPGAAVAPLDDGSGSRARRRM